MAYSPRRPVSWTVVRRPGLFTLIAIEHPQDLLVVRVRVVERAIGVEDEIRLSVLERAFLDATPDLVELLPVYAPILEDVAWFGEDDRVLKVLQLLLHVQNGCRGKAVELVAAGSFDRVDDREPAAEAEGPLRGVGAGPNVLGHLHLLLRRDELVAPGQAWHEPDHGHKPRRAEQRRDKVLLRVVRSEEHT